MLSRHAIMLASIAGLLFAASAACEEIEVDDPTWNLAYTLHVTPDTEQYLVKGKPYTGILFQEDQDFSEYLTVQDGAVIRDSSVYYIDKKSGKKYCTDVKAIEGSVDVELVTYEGAAYTDRRDRTTGRGTSIYTENGKVCKTAVYDDLSYTEYGRCLKQDWFDELLE